MSFPQTSFDRRDANLRVVVALPAQGAVATSNAIDLGNETAPLLGTESDVLVEIPALPTYTATTGAFGLVLQDSADNVSFNSVSQNEIGGAATGVTTGTLTANVAGVATTGRAFTRIRFRLPPRVRRYLRLQITANASTGSVTGDVTMQMVA